MITSMSNSKRAVELARWLYGFIDYCLSPVLKEKSRFLKMTPGIFSKQIIYDRQFKSFFRITSRNDIDLAVARQIFANEDYAIKEQARRKNLGGYLLKITQSGKTPLIIDCGGNSGLAAKYFSETYKDSLVICIEPDVGNIEAAKLNNLGNSRIEFLLAGVGNSDERANIIDPGEGNWAYRTVMDPAGQTEMISINSLLKKNEYKDCVPFLIKIDIEGFEDNLFEKNVDWLDLFPVVIIELHDWMLPGQATSRNFLRVVSEKDRDFIYRSENVFSFSNPI